MWDSGGKMTQDLDTQNKDICERETRLRKCLMETLGGRSRGDLDLELWFISNQGSREGNISN